MEKAVPETRNRFLPPSSRKTGQSLHQGWMQELWHRGTHRRKQSFSGLMGLWLSPASESHSGNYLLQVGQEACQNSPPYLRQSMWHRRPVHKARGMLWKALEMRISAFFHRRDSWVPGSLGRALRPKFSGTHPGFLGPELIECGSPSLRKEYTRLGMEVIIYLE